MWFRYRDDAMRVLPTVLLISALSLAAARAEARTVRDEPYPLDTTWNAAVRLVRVDFGFTIDERDRDLGYFTFQYREGRRLVPGSMEVLRTEIDGRPGTRVILQVPQMPNYVEAMMLAHLTRKLRSEFGEPPSAPPRAPTPPASERPPEQPASPSGPAQPSGAAPTPSASNSPSAPSGRWEAPRRIRYIDDFSE